MTEILNLELWGDCDLCKSEDLEIWVFVDSYRKGHKLCRDCIKKLVEWGLIQKPDFKLESEE